MTTAAPCFILPDICAILSQAKTVYSANVVFANVPRTVRNEMCHAHLYSARYQRQLNVDDKKINTPAYIRGRIAYETLFHLLWMWDKFATKRINIC